MIGTAMADEQPLLPTAEFLGSRTAIRLGAILLVGVTVIALLSMRDRSRVALLEQLEEVTAVGDNVYFQAPKQRGASAASVATLNGEPLSAVNYDKVKVSDPDMLRVGHDETSRLTIYRKRERTNSKERERKKPDDAALYVKIAPGEYIEVRPGKP